MRNAIKYYYNIAVNQINRFDDYFLFDNYMLKELKDEINFDIYNILNFYKLKTHKIIFNIYNSYYTKIDNKLYVLYELCEYSEITLDEIIDYNNNLLNIDVSNLKNVDNVLLWENKTDYFEIYYNTNNNLLNEVFPYYIGLSEFAIRICNEFKLNLKYGIVHRRVKSFFDFYCPDNFIVDFVTRDYSEYLKSQFFLYNNSVKNIIDYIFSSNYTLEECIYFFSRVCFPSYFYDYINNLDIIKKYIVRINEFEYVLVNINNKFNDKYGVELINWIKKI